MNMNKKTKTAIAVGVVGIAAYLLYKQSQKNKPFANFTRRLSPSKVTIKAACLKSPTNGGTYTGPETEGKVAYSCCGQGVFGYIKSDVPCDKVQGSTKETSFTTF